MSPITTPSSDSDAATRPNPQYMAAFACGVAALLYIATVRFEFVYDDQIQIVQNPLVHSWRALPWLFKTDVWAFSNPLLMGSYWRPFFMVWLLINHTFFGLNPFGWHLFAVIVHVVATYLVFRVAAVLSNDQTLAGIAALLFAVHPVHLETVAWVSGATDSLIAVFLLSSFLWFVHGLRTGCRWPCTVAASVAYASALLVKETAIVFPALVFAYLILYEYESTWTERVLFWVRSLLPFLLVSGLYLAIRGVVLHGFSHTNSQISWTLLLSLPGLLCFYWKHLVFPVRLGIYYQFPHVQSATLMGFWIPFLICIVAALTFVALFRKTRDHLIPFAVAWLLLPIFPLLLIPGRDFAHDRYLYLPTIGFCLIVASILRRVRFGVRSLFGIPAAQFGIAAGLALGLCLATSAQEIYWASDLLLFRRAVEIAPGNINAFNNLGVALANRGMTNEARFAFQQVVKRNPDYWQALYHLALEDFMDGQYPEAETYLLRAAQVAPMEADVAALLADTQVHLGKFAESEAEIRHALSLKPYKPGYRRVLASALYGQGRTTEAIEEAETDLKADPESSLTRDLLSRMRKSPRVQSSDTFSSQK